jgi:hypothetical protein
LSDFSAEPIQPDRSSLAAAANLIASWRALRLRTRVVVVLYAVLGGIGSAYASYTLVREVHHWGSWAFAVLVLDRIAVASLVVVAVLIAPESFVASLLTSSFRHAKTSAILVGVGVSLTLVAIFGFTLWELWKAR